MTPKLAARTAWLLLATAPSLGAMQQDLFQPNLRWTHPAPLDAPWIPESVAFAVDGEMVWASGNFGTPQLMVLPAPGQVLGEVVHRGLGVSDSITILSATARDGGDALFAVAQYAAPDPLQRSTEVMRFDPLGPPVGTDLQPVWTHDSGLVVNGPARVAVDDLGRVCCLAVWNDSASQVQLDWLNGLNGNLVRRVNVAATGLNVLDVSDDGTRVALGGGRAVFVFDSLTGNVLHQEALSSSTNAIAISGDGTRVAVGSFSELRLLEELPGGYADAWTVTAGPMELPTRVALSEDGDTVAIGWWNFFSGTAVRYEVVDGDTAAQLNEVSQVGASGGLQHFPQAICVTPDGSRIAFGGWGNGGPDPEIVLLERGVPAPVMEVNLPGSVRALDLDPTGRRIVVGAKNVHANQFASTGEVRLYETGEDDLVQVRHLENGGDLEIATRMPGALSVVLLVGVLADQPSPFMGFGGELALNRRVPIHIEVEMTDANGRADFDLPLPVDAEWVGETLAVQALFRLGGGVQELSRTVQVPLLY